MKTLMNALRTSFLLTLVLTVLLGAVYPLAVLAVAQGLFHHRANGSLIERGDKVIGSSLIGQNFQDPKYFWGRLSATVPPYNPSASSGSNMNPGNPKLIEAANARIAALQQADPANKALVPVELVTASASGLDPHLSMAAILYQLPRVAKARGLQEDAVKAVVERYAIKPGLGLFGHPYINIVQLNLALDDMSKEDTGKEKR